MKQKLFILILVFTTIKVEGQTFAQKEETLNKVFQKIVEAFGNAQPAPELELLPNSRSERVIAIYMGDPRPVIRIDEKLLNICLELKTDSLNALAVIIAHELAHYYNDHLFCSDYAYALSENSSLRKKILGHNVGANLNNETIADFQGIWHAAIAGYYPFGIFDKLIDNIYKAYKLPANLRGYPTKSERKVINSERQDKVATLLPQFEAGNILLQIGKYEEAARCFNEIIVFFPSRENYNNRGVARVLHALSLKPRRAMEFIYPVELDPTSRLQDNSSPRSIDETNEKHIERLLQDAKKDFDVAIRLDPDYAIARINLACVYDLLENSESAIGELKGILAPTVQQSQKIDMIKAIAYFHEDNTAKATLSFNKLSSEPGSISNYNKKLYELNNDPVTRARYSEDWLKRNEGTGIIPDSLKAYFEKCIEEKKPCIAMLNEKGIKICITETQTEMHISLGDKKLKAIKVAYSDNITAPVTKQNNYWLVPCKGLQKSWLVKQ